MLIRRAAERQEVRFALVGLANTLTDVAVFAVLVWLGVALAAANVVAYGAGALLSFMVNRGWTFGASRNSSTPRRQALRFIGLNVVTVSVSTLAVVALASILPVAIAKAFSVVLVATLSFLGMRFFVFPPLPGR